MISLVTIIVTPIIFIGLILTVSSNYKKKVRLVETSNIKHISLLEEKKMSVSNVKGQYYNGVINNYTSNIMPLNG
jgi:ABC-type enterochelin transport system permease subunit